MNFLPDNYEISMIDVCEYPEFTTHSNYLKALKEISDNIEISINHHSKEINENKILSNKIKLINLTYENLIEEYKKVYSFKEYSIICSSWIPVKSYYLIFNQLLVLGYLLTGKEDFFKRSHKSLRSYFKNKIRTNELIFNKAEFNNCIIARDVERWKIPKSENLKIINPDLNIRIKQIYKILLRYTKEDYKFMKKIKKLSGQKRDDFLNSTRINLLEFFYWYRIKANYRDMEFVSTDVPTDEFFIFYKNYFLLSMNLYCAFSKIINAISLKELKQKLI